MKTATIFGPRSRLPLSNVIVKVTYLKIDTFSCLSIIFHHSCSVFEKPSRDYLQKKNIEDAFGVICKGFCRSLKVLESFEFFAIFETWKVLENRHVD